MSKPEARAVLHLRDTTFPESVVDLVAYLSLNLLCGVGFHSQVLTHDSRD